MSEYEAAVRAWSEHLRAGGTTPWAAFWPNAPTGTGTASGSRDPSDIPGAAQLELVRRLAKRWRGRSGFEALADRVLTRDAPGRGMAAMPLLHPASAARSGVVSGAPPVDPEKVPVEELVRVGIGVLADIVLQPKDPAPTSGRIFRQRLPLVLGAPVSRHALARTVDGFGPRDVLVCAPSLPELLTEVWSTRVQLGAGVRWRRFVQVWGGRDLLPPSAAADRLAQQAAARVGAERVHVFVGSAARRPPLWAAPEDPAPLTVESVDLLRRLNPVLGLRAGDGERDEARATAVRLVAGGRPRPLALPEHYEGWAQARAERIAHAIAAGGYAVHGDLEEFVAGVAAPRQPRPQQVLDRLLAVLVKAEERD